jgi:uncharacterized protein YbaR (Trm112 family)
MPKPILPLLVCPLSKQNLFLLSDKKADLLQTALSKGELHYLDGTPLLAGRTSIQFLITENAHHLYSVIDGIPVLLESKQIDMQGLQF